MAREKVKRRWWLLRIGLVSEVAVNDLVSLRSGEM
jgi:hypothetical protein